MSATTTRVEDKPHPPRKRARRRGVFRRSIIRLHRWVGIAVATWIVLQAVTGSLIAFSDQIDAWSRPQLFHHSAGDIGPQAASAAAKAAVARASVASVQMPVNETGVYVVTVAARSASGSAPSQRLVYLDPGTGHVNGIRDPNGGFTHWLLRLHTGLLQTKLLGVKGTTIVGWLGVIAIFVIITGAYLWLWPSVRKLSTLFRMRRKSPLVFSLDLHRLIGFVVFPLVLVALLSGVNLIFHSQLRQFWYDVVPGKDSGVRTAVIAPKSLPHQATTPRVSLDAAVTSAKQATGGRVDSISIPFSPTGSYAVQITRGWDPASGPRGRGGNLTAYVDQYSGSVLRVIKPSDYSQSAQLYEYWSTPVHLGTEGGITTRILIDVAGVGTLLLIGTGFSLTVVRHRKRARRQSALSEALPKMPAALLGEAVQQSWIDNVTAGKEIVREGAIADAFYVILAGEFDVLKGPPGNQERVAQLGPGDSFGEIGLMYTGVRTASVIAATDGELVVVPTEEFQLILRQAERDGVNLSQAGLTYTSERFARTAAPRPGDSEVSDPNDASGAP